MAMSLGMEANHTFERTAEIDERFFDDWVAFGMAELNAYLGKHARFADFYERRDPGAAR
jgi:hypothetical protein